MLPDMTHIDPDLVPILNGLDKRITDLEAIQISPLPVNVITWKPVPTVSFVQGIASSFSITGFVSNSLNLPLTITLSGALLPPGILFDGSSFNYDGKGPAVSVSGFFLTADDGRP